MSRLAEILKNKLAEVEEAKKGVCEDELFIAYKEIIKSRRNFIGALKSKIQAGNVAIIAELKKASPSAGTICADYNPTEQAKKYEEGAATCLSVLTDQKYFQGHPDHLKQAKLACNLPVLRKDFIIDPWQVYESAAMGADAILLIAAAFKEPSRLEHLIELATSFNMAVLLEFHTAAELTKYSCFAKRSNVLVGLNSRNLSTFEVNLKAIIELADDAMSIGSPNPLIVESGITSPGQISGFQQIGINSFLIGTLLMQAADPLKTLQDLQAPQHSGE